MLTPPVKVLVPLNVSVPVPVLMKEPPVPEITPAKVVELLAEPTVKALVPSVTVLPDTPLRAVNDVAEPPRAEILRPAPEAVRSAAPARLPEPLSTSEPPETVVRPVKVLAAPSVNVPAPSFVKVPVVVPITPFMVTLPEPPTVKFRPAPPTAPPSVRVSASEFTLESAANVMSPP